MNNSLKFKKLMLQLMTGAITLQTAGCTQIATFITTGAAVVTAGGVIFIVSKIIRS